MLQRHADKLAAASQMSTDVIVKDLTVSSEAEWKIENDTSKSSSFFLNCVVQIHKVKEVHLQSQVRFEHVKTQSGTLPTGFYTFIL